MGIFDDAFAPYTGIPQGILPPGYGSPQGNFIGGRSLLGDLWERIQAGAARGAGAGAFGGNYGYDTNQPYSPQQMPTSPTDLALGVNRPAYAPDLSAPTNIASAPVGGRDIPQDVAPQLQIPPAAQPVAFQGQPQQSAPMQEQPQGPSAFQQAVRRFTGTGPQLQMITDFLGNQTPYWVDAASQTMRPANMGGGVSEGLGLNTADLQKAMSLPNRVEPTTGRDENFIKSLGPVLGAQVTSALNGDSKLDGRMLQKIQPLAARAEPGWTQQTYQQRLGAYKSFYGGGKDQETARALSQSIGHAAELFGERAPGLPGTQMPLFNWAANTVNTQLLGKGEANNFLINAHAVAAELSRLFKQVNMSDTEIKKWEEGLSPNMSLEQQRGMARTLHGLYDEALQALEKKRVDGLGPALAAKAPPLIDSHTQQNIARVRDFGIGTPQASQKPGVTSTGIKWSLQ